MATTTWVLVAYLSAAAAIRSVAPANLAIFLYALAIVPAALMLVRQKGWVDKSVADVFYYTLATFAVVMLFIYESPGRHRVELLGEYVASAEAAGAADRHAQSLDSQIKQLKTLAEQLKTAQPGLLAAVREAAARSRKVAEEYATITCTYANDATFAASRKPPPAHGEPIRLQSAELQQRDCIRAQNEVERPIRQQLENLQSLDELKALGPALKASPMLDASLVLGGESFSLSQVHEVLFNPHYRAELATSYTQVLADAERFRSTLIQINTQMKDIDDPAHATWLYALVGKGVKSGWPFLLIALLGLKLSRAEGRKQT